MLEGMVQLIFAQPKTLGFSPRLLSPKVCLLAIQAIGLKPEPVIWAHLSFTQRTLMP